MSDNKLDNGIKNSTVSLIVRLFRSACAVIWTARGKRWKSTLIALSVCGNLLSLFVVLLATYSMKREQAKLAPGFVLHSSGPLRFCRAPTDSELARILPNTIYVSSGGVIRARFEFGDSELTVLTTTTVMDEYGRPWIDASVNDGTFMYNQFVDDEQEDPVFSLRDRNGNGIPDIKVNWNLGQSFEAEGDLAWRRIDRDRSEPERSTSNDDNP